MECANCGGLVIWKGPLINLTHTECQQCGAVNNQVLENYTEEELEQEDEYLAIERGDEE
ncbi:hypothetical protein [Pectobacterium brasiliense]|uniref:hypothetical protein n=1 Tax=Pectobacterium brasiliense TaxID=180957 RepID=UPI003987D695